jgi:phosphopantetheine adenylyltransferase
MRQVTTNEVLALNKFLQMETNSLSMAKAGINIVSDEQLKTLTQAGITATEGRIRGIQQFIVENNITSAANVNIATNTSTNNQSLNNLPKGVM